MSSIEGAGWRMDVSESYVVVEDYWIPDRFELWIEPDDGQPDNYIRVEVRDGVPTCTALHFTSSPGQRGVRQADLRVVELAAFVNGLVAGFSFRVDHDAKQVIVPFHDDTAGSAYKNALRFIEHQRRGPGLRDITPELLARVAEIYRANIDRAPTQAVAQAFNVKSRMASEYVQRARRANLLPPTTVGKKKA